jgi:hypothetical protein
MENHKDILDKIKKLMAHQSSALEMGSIAEAEAFATKIQNLLNKYNISVNQIQVDKEDNEVMDAEFALKIPSVGSRTNFWIYSAIARTNWCKAYIIGKGKNNKMIIIGTAQNIEMCKYIHSVVTPVFLRVGKKKYKEEYLPSVMVYTTPVGLDTYLRTFIRGCADGLYEKLRAEMEKFVKENSTEEAVAELGCTALSIVRGNEIALTQFVSKKYGESGRSSSTKSSYAGGAYSQGVETGKNVGINKGVESSKPIQRKMIG